MDKGTPQTHPPENWSGTADALRDQLGLAAKEIQRLKNEVAAVNYEKKILGEALTAKQRLIDEHNKEHHSCDCIAAIKGGDCLNTCASRNRIEGK